MLLARRLFCARVAATSPFSDKLILILLTIQICLGMLTIPVDLLHLRRHAAKPDQLEPGIVTFRPDPAQYLQEVNWLFKVHMVLGLTIFLIFPLPVWCISAACRWAISYGDARSLKPCAKRAFPPRRGASPKPADAAVHVTE
ncbi:respiratory nitrate reductase subunit gamma [Edwardsiella anguillarum]|nr:respiratory nitrate reductase subunit gamma [Edwardsiella anguillarum]